MQDISKVQRIVTPSKSPMNVSVMSRESGGVKECQMEKVSPFFLDPLSCNILSDRRATIQEIYLLINKRVKCIKLSASDLSLCMHLFTLKVSYDNDLSSLKRNNIYQVRAIQRGKGHIRDIREEVHFP